MRRTGSLLVLAALLGASSARAQGVDAAAAQGLFDEAKQLMAQGKVAAACPKFLASLNIDPKPGTALNLAACYDQTGQIASAWARYLETASLAQRAGQADRERYATEHAAALQARLSRLSISAPSAARGLTVWRDGVVLDAASLGVRVPVDPGEHLIEAHAPGKRAWSKTVTVTGDAARIVVEIPPLDGLTAGTGAPRTLSLEAPLPLPSPLDAKRAALGAPRALALTSASVGGAGIVVGAITGSLAFTKASAIATMCQGTACLPGVEGDLSTGRMFGRVSTVSFVFGGAGVVAGIIGLVVDSRKKARPGIDPNGASVVGSF